MKITNLKASPHLFKATIALIEKSFEYELPNHFEIDFAPLINESNFENCFIAIDEKENVLAHIGICERKILDVTIAMLGGIAVDEKHRGEGIFQELFQEVMSEKRSDVGFFLLWSDQEKLYKKYGFNLCGTQLEIKKSNNPQSFNQTKLNQLNESQIKELHNLYLKSFATIYTTTERNLDDWKQLSLISSADLYIEENKGSITSYFFMNKGQDLNGIIYEYGSTESIEKLIPKISSYGKVWIGANFVDSQEMQFQFFLAPANTRLFAKFVQSYTNGKILIHEINQIKQEVYFYFNDELISLETEDFLRGMLGPGIFEEIEKDIKPFFISGLISI